MSTCSDCSKGDLLPGEPTGSTIDDFGGAYLAEGANADPSKRAIILLTDAFGLALKNSKILADSFAKSLGCDVWVPDIFNGRPLIGVDDLTGYTPDRAGVRTSFYGMIRTAVVFILRLPNFILSRPSVVDHRINLFIEKLKAEKKYEEIGAVGYCFGGSCAIRLGSRSQVSSIVINHPGFCSKAEIQAINVPASWACAEDDVYFGRSKRNDAEAIFAERKGKDNYIDYEFRDYKGTAHGFAARPNLTIPDVKEGHEKAFQQAVDWFNKTLATLPA